MHAVYIEILGVVTRFRVLMDGMPLSNDGIIGLEFLHAESAEISFLHDTLVLDETLSG